MLIMSGRVELCLLVGLELIKVGIMVWYVQNYDCAEPRKGQIKL